MSCDQTPSGTRPREEESPKLQKKNSKRIRSNEIFSSLSSGRNICVGKKRKAVGKLLKKSPRFIPIGTSKGRDLKSSEHISPQQEPEPKPFEPIVRNEKGTGFRPLPSQHISQEAVREQKSSTSQSEEHQQVEDKESKIQPPKSQYGRLFSNPLAKGAPVQQESAKEKNGGKTPWIPRTTVDIDAITEEDILSDVFTHGSSRLKSMLSVISSAASNIQEPAFGLGPDGPSAASSNPLTSEGFNFGVKPAESTPMASSAPNVVTPFQCDSNPTAPVHPVQQQQASAIGPSSIGGTCEQKPMEERHPSGSLPSTKIAATLQANPPTFDPLGLPIFISQNVNPTQNPVPATSFKINGVEHTGMYSGGLTTLSFGLCSPCHKPTGPSPSAPFQCGGMFSGGSIFSNTYGTLAGSPFLKPTGPSPSAPFQCGEQQVVDYKSQNRSWKSPAYQAAAQGGRAGFQLDPRELAAVIKEDVIAMEEGGQWPLSCYTPFKECQNFPNFYDTSMEEVRYEAYQALASNTFDEYVKKMGDLIQETRLKWSLLKNPTLQIYFVIEKMASGKSLGENMAGPSSSLTFKTFSFNSPPSATASSSFSLGTNAAFVTSSPQQSQPPPGAFFSNPQPSSAASSFRFALPQQSPQPQQPLQLQQNVGVPFGVPPPSFPQSQPVFAGSPSGFGQSGGMMFASNMTTQAAVSTPLPQQPTPAGFYGGQPEANKQPSIFGMSQAPPVNQSFGSPANTGAFGQKVPQPVLPDLSVYTPVDDLTEMEKKEYMAVTFTLGSIPLRPPARELCM